MNEQIDRLNYSSRFDEYICECGRKSCVGAVSLSRREYDEIRRQPRTFVVLPGHWRADSERVVQDGPQFQVIEKIGEAAAPLDHLHAGPPVGAELPTSVLSSNADGVGPENERRT